MLYPCTLITIHYLKCNVLSHHAVYQIYHSLRVFHTKISWSELWIPESYESWQICVCCGVDSGVPVPRRDLLRELGGYDTRLRTKLDVRCTKININILLNTEIEAIM